MKVIIDLIEDVREQIADQEDFILTAMLLKEDPEDQAKLIYAEEAPINLYRLNDDSKQLVFKIDGSDTRVSIGALIPPLLILGMDAMMYELRMNVNAQYDDIEIIGFGKSMEEKKYILFIRI